MVNSDSPSIYPLEGGCACGHIRYRLETRPLITHCCHCTSCQRETGTAFALNAIIESHLVTRLPPAPPSVPASRTQPAQTAGPLLTPPAGAEDAADLGTITINTPSESGKGQQIVRCAMCRVAVWSYYGGVGSVPRTFVRVGTLDEAWQVRPDVHIYTRSRRGFFKLDGGIPEFEGYYPSKEGVWREESLVRWEKLLEMHGHK